MPAFGESFREVQTALNERYGSLGQGDALGDPFAALVAVALGRFLDAPKRTRAVNGLAEAGLLDPASLSGADAAEIAEVLKGAGVSVPARSLAPLRRLAHWVAESYSGRVESLRDDTIDTAALREELVGLNGIGPATADSLLLFALRRAAYPVDRASYRILVRHGWLDADAGYDEARSVVERQCSDDPSALAQLSAALERVGREYCRAAVAKCERCPLRPFLPENGPVEIDAY